MNHPEKMVNVSKLEPKIKRALFEGIKRFDVKLYRYLNDPGLKKMLRVFAGSDLYLPRENLEIVWRRINGQKNENT